MKHDGQVFFPFIIVLPLVLYRISVFMNCMSPENKDYFIVTANAIVTAIVIDMVSKINRFASGVAWHCHNHGFKVLGLLQVLPDCANSLPTL